ncbi:DUF6153 family protein [Streptomyces sp. NPDC127033]|uniref:DUF6153 family protein n=1 Tax=Streptomyces sp. NPDC127033 TaxID=3347110 RepID=UPI003663E64A
MIASRYARAGGVVGHLLLVVVLALGVFAMHTLGHPEGTSSAATGASSSHMGGSAASGMTTGDVTVAAVATDTKVATDTRDAKRTDDGMASDDSASSHGSSTGMDMTSLCVAVLGAWVLAALLYAAFTRRPGLPGVHLPKAVFSPRPGPPPRPPDLAELSVLRT